MINNRALIEVNTYKKQFVYKVEKGDTLLSIAKKYNTTRQILIFINGRTQEVKAGEFILVERADGEEYIVQPTDSLESIAKLKGKSVYELVNKIKTDTIYTGQKLYI